MGVSGCIPEPFEKVYGDVICTIVCIARDDNWWRAGADGWQCLVRPASQLSAFGDEETPGTEYRRCASYYCTSCVDCLDVNIKFSGVRDFEFTGELCVFDLLGIMLYHGWVVDPSSEVAPVITDLSYNQLTNNIFAWREEAVKNNNNDLLVKAMLCEEFMANSGSQLTIHGLFELGSALQREEIAVLFRNNHFSTIYKRGDQLYQLLTDQGFLHENMVWETLNDVDATFSEFVNGNFQPIPPVPESTPSSEAAQNMTMQQQINSDQQLAAMLQHEVELQQRQQQNFERLKDSLGLHNMSDEEMAQKLQEEENRLAAEAEAEAGATRYQPHPSSDTAGATNPSASSRGEEKKRLYHPLKYFEAFILWNLYS
nr:ubiquitin carboxyl-terminal hydrolase MINDY-2-like [Penaeus vannamei]